MRVGLPLLFGLVGSFFVPLACGGDPQVGDSGGTGGIPSADEVCEELFGDACGRDCSEDEPCPEGMHCDAGACRAVCGDGFPCSGGRVCQDDGTCSGIDVPDDECEEQTCEELGFECGFAVDDCGTVIDCAEEGRTCSAVEMCVGGVDAPTECVPASFLDECDVCDAIPDCTDEPSETILRGRVVSPGRDDDDTANQVGIPNALVYVLRTTDLGDLPAIEHGLPGDGNACDRCEDQDYGPVLAGAVTDATGAFEFEGNLPVDREFLLVVKAGKFRRVTTFTIPAAGACETTEMPTGLPDNPTRLPRHLEDGLAVSLPHIAVVTGQLDAMECVFHKMGIDADQFGAPNVDVPIHLYRSNGAWPPEAAACAACAACGGGGGGNATCRANNCNGGDSCDSSCRDAFVAACQADFEAELLTDEAGAITDYDMAVLDCEGGGWDSDVSRDSEPVREYVNRGGRLFASHLSFTWLHEDADAEGATPYDEDEPLLTGLGPAASWVMSADSGTAIGTGHVSIGRDEASPRVENFADWMISEGILADEDDTFSIDEARSQVESSADSSGLGPSSEEFVYCSEATAGNGCNDDRPQQFSFNTPYGAPDDAICGRVAYSGFHVSVGSSGGAVFPDHCDGDLTDQEKVLLYMLFDLGACVGDDPPPPPCVPVTCPEAACGFVPNGCGGLLDCGSCGPVTR